MYRTPRWMARLHTEDSGQDLLERALVMALIALAAVAGMAALASGIDATFSRLGNIMQKYT